MDLLAFKRLHADLSYVRDDPDSALTDVQTFHLARALRVVRDEIAARETVVRPAPIADSVEAVIGRRAG